MSVFDTNLMWDESEVCNECKADDRREDHGSECDCFCHNPAKIRFFEGQLKVADALAKEFDWVKQTVHRAHHEGPLEGCPKNTCDAANKALANYEKARGMR